MRESPVVMWTGQKRWKSSFCLWIPIQPKLTSLEITECSTLGGFEKDFHFEWIYTRNLRRFLHILETSTDGTHPRLTRSSANSRTRPHKILGFRGMKPFHREINIFV
jgi:hypothetical protein